MCVSLFGRRCVENSCFVVLVVVAVEREREREELFGDFLVEMNF